MSRKEFVRNVLKTSNTPKDFRGEIIPFAESFHLDKVDGKNIIKSGRFKSLKELRNEKI